ncbi:MAG TPA: 2-alkenal reductase, partial [Myxococcales bacterium]|nr:2-alkenal reductase [Myxococcales bacterium]
MAKQVLMPLLTEGKVARSWLGISVEDLSPQMLRGLGLPPTLAGVMVSEIVRGAPGEQAGLKVGDVITSFDGVRVNDAQRLRWLAAVGGAGREAQVS